ncbi:DUF1801 domain-containing protein [Rubrivirga sp. IMCC45206]|uniref:DUF1801 domain-containing protein n=1 Tax=Rubrivirga sp. IMCC45206 TaxID=3391614 RepID=UPI00398FC03E
MAENKTQPTDASVEAFLDAVEPERRRDDARRIAAIMAEVTSETPEMWGEQIVGYGRYHYTYASGREGDWMRVGFAPQTRHTSLYLMGCNQAERDAFLDRLGPHRAGVGCVYVTRLDAVDAGVLREMVAASYAGTAGQAV